MKTKCTGCFFDKDCPNKKMDYSDFTEALKNCGSRIAKDALINWAFYGGKVRAVSTQGSGRWTRITDRTEEVKRFLKSISVSFESGNDAPRGGKRGNYVVPNLTVVNLPKPSAVPSADEVKQSETAERMKDFAEKNEAASELLRRWVVDGAKHPAAAEVWEAKNLLGVSWKQIVRFYAV